MPAPEIQSLLLTAEESLSISTTTDAEAKIKLLRKFYLKRIPNHLEQIENLWQRFLVSAGQAQVDQQDALRLLQLQVHRLSSGSNFGYKEISQAAQQLEDYILCHLEASPLQVVGDAEIDQIASMLQNLVEIATKNW